MFGFGYFTVYVFQIPFSGLQNFSEKHPQIFEALTMGEGRVQYKLSNMRFFFSFFLTYISCWFLCVRVSLLLPLFWYNRCNISPSNTDLDMGLPWQQQKPTAQSPLANADKKCPIAVAVLTQKIKTIILTSGCSDKSYICFNLHSGAAQNQHSG